MKRLYIDNITDYKLAMKMFILPERYKSQCLYCSTDNIVKILIKDNIIIDFCNNDILKCSKCSNHIDELCLNIQTDNFINFKQYIREEKLKRILND